MSDKQKAMSESDEASIQGRIRTIDQVICSCGEELGTIEWIEMLERVVGLCVEHQRDVLPHVDEAELIREPSRIEQKHAALVKAWGRIKQVAKDSCVDLDAIADAWLAEEAVLAAQPAGEQDDE